MSPCSQQQFGMPSCALKDTIVHLVGSPMDEFNFKLNIYYSSALDPEKHGEFEHIWAVIRPTDKKWSFTNDLSQVVDLTSFERIKDDSIQWLDLPSALFVLTNDIKPRLAVPHLFCFEGVTRYRSLLETCGIPFIGSSSQKAGLSMNKALSRSVLIAMGIPCPAGVIVQKDSIVNYDDLEYPCVVKPTTTENSIGMTLVQNKEGMHDALDLAFQYSPDVIIDKFIKGREVRCSVIEKIDSFGNMSLVPTAPQEYHLGSSERLRATEDKLQLDEQGLPLGKALSTKTSFMSATEEPELFDRIQKVTMKIHRVLQFKDFSMVDFRVDEQGNPWALEVNLFSSFGAKSILSIQAGSVGMDDVQLFKNMVNNNSLSSIIPPSVSSF